MGGIATAIAAPEATKPPAAPEAPSSPAMPEAEAPPPSPGPAAAAAAAKLQAAGALVQVRFDSEAAVRKQLDDALNVYAQQQKEADQKKESSDQAGMLNSSVTGLSTSSDPEWSLLGDAAVTSIDFSKPTLSLGLERATPSSLVMVALKKSTTDNSVSGTSGDPVFGRAVLEPALASFSVAAHLEWRGRGYIQCSTDCRLLPKPIVNTKRSKGGYVTVEASYAKLTDTSAMRLNGSAVSGYFSPLAISAGFVYRLDGVMPDGVKLGTSKLGLTGYAGLAMRAISGDLDKADRTSVFGTSARYFAGPELGATVQIGNVLIGPRLIALTNGGDRIPGLTGLQVDVNLSFILPWNVVGGK